MGQKQQLDSTNVRKFKGTTVFDWDAEPTEERPSEFAESSLYLSQTAISRSSGFYKRGGDFSPSSRSGASTLERARPRPPQKKGGSNAVWIVAIGMVLIITAGGLYGLMRWFHI